MVAGNRRLKISRTGLFGVIPSVEKMAVFSPMPEAGKDDAAGKDGANE